ncbi:hypothetical protein BDW74DRAFT_172290 [Aspergillus multicolor]|uniref:uncharacterized protein n=1 Tax=Aspergillus multicolor TaxID=41759 RepID=UPI003CCCB858
MAIPALNTSFTKEEEWAPIDCLPWDMWFLIFRHLTGTDPTIEVYPYLFDNLPASLCAIPDTDIHRMEYTYREGYTRPLLALIMAFCPDVQRVAMHAHEPDQFLEDVLCWATYGRNAIGRPEALAFQNLIELSLAPSLPPGSGTGTAYTAVSLERPYCLLLPQLGSLHAHRAHLVFGWNGKVDISQRDHSTVQNLILPHDQVAIHGPALHERLWTALRPFKDSLEYLDIHQRNFTLLREDNPFPDDSGRSFCPPLSEFTNLRQLNLTPLLLAGHRCFHGPGYKLYAHLPPSLESLGLYVEDMEWLDGYLENLDVELGNVAKCGAKNGLLAIVFDHPVVYDPHAMIDASNDGTREIVPLGKMRAVAAKKGIMFIEHGQGKMFCGGSETPFAAAGDLMMKEEGVRIVYMESEIGEVIPRGMTVFGFRGRLGRPGISRKRGPVDFGDDDEHSRRIKRRKDSDTLMEV